MKPARWYYPLLSLLLAAISGLLLALALPPRQIGFLGWLAFIPLLVAARLSRRIIAACCGLICSLTTALVLSGRLTDAAQYANLLAIFGSLGMVLAFVAASASAAKKMSPAIEPFFIACVGVTAELLSICLFPVNVAISQYRNPAMLHLASITGIWGVSFLIWLVSASVIALFRDSRKASPAAAISVIALVAALGVGFPANSDGRTMRVAAIQAADPLSAADRTRDVRGMADVVVWPEHRLDGTEASAPSQAAKRNRIPVVANIREYAHKGIYYNTAYLFDASGRVIGKQRKRFPFGNENQLFSRGKQSQPIDCGKAKLGMAICFDSQFTAVTRDLARKGADIAMIPIHDPETPNSLINYLHATFIPFRAAENGMPIVCAECYGLSSIIDGSGRIIARSPAGSSGAVFAPVRLRSTRTIATRWGDWFGYLCALLTVLIPAAHLSRITGTKGDARNE